MKKVLFLLVVFMFFAVGCVEVVMPASNAYSESNSESSPNVSPIIVNVPAQQSGSQPQSNQFQAPQSNQYQQPAGSTGLTPLQEGNGPAHLQNADGSYIPQSSPAYLDECIKSWNNTGKFTYNNCSSELKKAGRYDELRQVNTPFVTTNPDTHNTAGASDGVTSPNEMLGIFGWGKSTGCNVQPPLACPTETP